MKKKLLLLILSMLGNQARCWSQEDGIYRLQLLCGEDSAYISAPTTIEQYKIVKDEEMYHVTIYGTQSFYENEVQFNVHKDDVNLLNNEHSTFLKDKTNIYDVATNGFKNKWFNNQPRYTLYPQDTWVTEQWIRVRPSQEAYIIASILVGNLLKADDAIVDSAFVHLWGGNGESKQYDLKTKLWKRVAIEINGVRTTITQHPWYKIYGDCFSVFMADPQFDEDYKEMTGYIRTTFYMGKNLTRENGDPCLINWNDENNYTLTFINNNGNICTETWTEE